jgi:hypothetical protein
VSTLLSCSDDRATTADTFDASALIPLELGTGRRELEALPPAGGRVELVYGPQGGYHLNGRYRFRGFAPDVYISFRVTPVEGGAPVNQVLDPVRRLAPRGLVQVDGWWESAFTELVILGVVEAPLDLVGRRFRWELFVREAATGRVATTEREILIVNDVQ